MSDLDYASIREEYQKGSLEIADTDINPIVQFKKWFSEAKHANVIEVNAMCLSTVDESGQPDARIVLLKGVEEGSFIFYTNYKSTKGDELKNQPKAALTFFWPELQRQVRVKGTVVKVNPDTSTQYFNSRPRASQLGAWVSPQSKVIADRAILENREKAYGERFENTEIPRPEHWGGYLVKPFSLEFWQGRPSRLHDRVLYTLTNNKIWKRERLAP